MALTYIALNFIEDLKWFLKADKLCDISRGSFHTQLRDLYLAVQRCLASRIAERAHNLLFTFALCHSYIMQVSYGLHVSGHSQKLTDRGKVAENMTVCLSGRMLPTMRVI